jgi:hypothetical protein
LELLKTVDTWFLLVVIVCLFGVVSMLGGYFLWSVKRIFSDLRESLENLEELIQRLTTRDNNHEVRLRVIEERCKLELCAHPGGRRSYDPPDVHHVPEPAG